MVGWRIHYVPSGHCVGGSSCWLGRLGDAHSFPVHLWDRFGAKFGCGVIRHTSDGHLGAAQRANQKGA
uniref:Uncharacterized protein n=1 Tax=Strigamia maritima TaxID=126957 RepID=T1JHD9_STRMM